MASQRGFMKLLGFVMPILVSVAFLGCSERPEDRLREFSKSECESGIHNVYREPKNLELGVMQLSRAALLGNRKAQFEVGVLYLNGEGVTADNVEAYAWLLIASETDRDVHYSYPRGTKPLETPLEIATAMATINNNLKESGMDVQLQADGALNSVSQKMSPDSINKGKIRAGYIRWLIFDEVRKRLAEIYAGK